MRKHVWDPLGMDSIVMDDPRALIPNRVRGYEIVNGKIRNSEFVDISSRFAAGGTRASVIDMLRFGKGTYEGKTLSLKSRDLMFKSMVTKGGSQTYYGAGIGTFPINGRYTLSHSGSQQETATFMHIFPSRKLVIAVALNLEDANRIPFVSKLFEVLTGEAWDTNAYTNDGREKGSLYGAMKVSFLEGRSSFEKTGGNEEPETQKIVEAFAQFNKYLNGKALVAANRTELLKKISRANRVPNGPFQKIGYFMSKALAEKHGADYLPGYSNTGPITFFDDYIKLDVPDGYKINDKAAAVIASWQKSWKDTNTAELRNIKFNTDTDFVVLGKRIKNELAGQKVYPDFGSQILNLLEPMAKAQKIPQVFAAGQLAAGLYPDLAAPNSNHGMFLVLFGQKEKGISYLKKGAAINPNGLVSPGTLADTSKDIADSGFAELGLRLISASIEIYPDMARLLDTRAGILIRKGEKAKAVEDYRKALAIDPNYPNAAAAKKAIAGVQQ